MSKILLSMAGVIVALSLGSNLALAGSDDAIAARKACMKANNAGLKSWVQIMKGQAPYDAAVVKASLDAMGNACSGWADFWPEDSKTSTTLKTHAAETIWTDKAGFEAAGNAAYKAETALGATKDEAGFKAAFPAAAQGCDNCHKTFRTAFE